MKITKMAFIALTSFYALQSFAVDLKPGTYFASPMVDDLTIYLKEVPGRKGSFLALISKEGNKGFTYLVDKFTSNKYGMVPLQALENNVVGAKNHNPSLVLTVSEDGNYDRVSVVANSADNNLGFKTSMSFKLKEKSSKTEWIKNLEGSFSDGTEKRAVSVSAQDINHEASLSIKSGTLAGDYTLRESRPGIHLVLRSSLSTTGVEVSEQTNMIAVFTCEGGLFAKDKLIIIDSVTGAMTKFSKNN